jgi:alkanesulfonate monooxygenase SsuD/methylene tetrahydromethanopterin reductase-like flavin-dependent oxidoreductase (luciferase family)
VAARIPIGVCIGTIRAEPAWWFSSAQRLSAAGYDGIWAWDHFMGRGDPSVPVVEGWTALSAAVAVTGEATLGTYVVNVMNRHPAVLARMASTLQALSGGRVALGIGIGGHPREHHALGIPFPDNPERVARLEETIGVLRALWSGGPVTRPGRFYPLDGAYGVPTADPPPPIIVGGGSPGAARLAARLGDGWTIFSDRFTERLPVYLESLQAAGRDRATQEVLVGVEGQTVAETSERLRPWLADLRGERQRLIDLGADAVVLTARSEPDVAGLLTAAERW